MHGAWVRFITDGTPADPALPKWPTYDTTRRATMWLDDESRVVDDPMADERRAWRGVEFWRPRCSPTSAWFSASSARACGPACC